ncbi:MAG TPA: SCO family protein [Rhizomicrobium sp.]|nr:SCO family protein [Rhizomicrobium sp.]
MTDIKGVMPDLKFSLTRANDNAPADAHSYRGKVSVLYFGYTHCPDVCPTTLSNLSIALNALGEDAKKVRVLFVSVDPDRDTIPVLKSYVSAFAPQIDGMRGTANQVADLARRYRVAFKVTPATSGRPYEVTHSNSIFIFDGAGRARFVTMSSDNQPALLAALRNLLN